MTKSFENVAAGVDDSYTITAFGLDGTVKFGPVTGMFEFMLCKNIAGANYTGGYTGPLYLGGTTINEMDTTLYWFGVNYGINPKMGIDLFYGALNDESSNINYELTRTSYGLRFRYSIAANFLVFPHLQMYDYDEGNGSATQIGADFYLVF